MPSEDNIIDAEVVEETENLPAVIDTPGTNERSVPMDDPRAGPRDWSTYASPERRCKAHKKTGEQCKNASVPGATVCRFHGGAAKHVKAAARARLENATDLMAKQLLGIALTAESEGVKLAAIKDALDRGGLKAPSEVVLSQGETKPYEELFEGISSMSREESRASRGYEGSPAPLVDRVDRPHTTEAETLSNTTEHDSRQGSDVDSEPYSQSAPPRQARPRDPDRDTHAQAPERHISGDEAIRQANTANRQVGALKAIESPHKRYRRP